MAVASVDAIGTSFTCPRTPTQSLGFSSTQTQVTVRIPKPLNPRLRVGVLDFITLPRHPYLLFSSSAANNHPSAGVFEASPLAAFLRVPLEWYRSATFAFFPDETNAMIHRVYTSPREQHAMRHFCGFCGTPLSYWSEEPRTEAEFIQLTLGSLESEDLGDLEDLGLLPGSDDEAETPQGAITPAEPAGLASQDAGTRIRDDHRREVVPHRGRETLGGLPWFDTLIEGSRLGTIRRHKGTGRSRDGTVRVEWEVVEYTEDDSGDDSQRFGKRKFDEREGNTHAMEGVED